MIAFPAAALASVELSLAPPPRPDDSDSAPGEEPISEPTEAVESDAPPSFDEIFRQFAPHVARMAMSLLGRPDEVDDVVQDVFLDAYRGFGKLRKASALRSWLFTITVRKARRRLRGQSVRRFIGLHELTDYSRLAAPGASPAQRAQVVALYRALDNVPAQARLAWCLRHVEGESLNRVAELCGCSRSTAHRRITLATELLRGDAP